MNWAVVLVIIGLGALLYAGISGAAQDGSPYPNWWPLRVAFGIGTVLVALGWGLSLK